MNSAEYKLTAADGTRIHVYEWTPADRKPAGIIQIVHGMAEHAGRYHDFASFLTKQGFAVFADDHRGHGKTASSPEHLGHLGKGNSWKTIVADLEMVGKHARNSGCGLPFFVLGHSMGSFLARKYVTQKGLRFHGAIFSGTMGHPGLAGYLGVMLAKSLLAFYPGRSPGIALNKLSFGTYNRQFEPRRTEFDWLTRDNRVVDKYLNDPFCGNVFSIRYFDCLFRLVLEVNSARNFRNTPADLPILLVSGTKDPVGNNGKGVEEVYNRYRKAGMKDISIRLYPDGRHEMLNEINHHEVYQLIGSWLKTRI